MTNKTTFKATDIPIDIKTEAVNWARNLKSRGSASKSVVDFSTIYDSYQYRNWKGSFKDDRLVLTALDEGQNPITNQSRTVIWKPIFADRHRRLVDITKL